MIFRTQLNSGHWIVFYTLVCSSLRITWKVSWSTIKVEKTKISIFNPLWKVYSLKALFVLVKHEYYIPIVFLLLLYAYIVNCVLNKINFWNLLPTSCPNIRNFSKTIPTPNIYFPFLIKSFYEALSFLNLLASNWFLLKE